VFNATFKNKYFSYIESEYPVKAMKQHVTDKHPHIDMYLVYLSNGWSNLSYDRHTLITQVQ